MSQDAQTFKPLRDQVLIEPIRTLERYGQMFGSFYVPDNPARMPGEILWEGLVIAVGPGDKLANVGMMNGEPTGLHRHLNPDQSAQPCTVKAGDRVIFYRRTSAFKWDVEIEGKDYAVVFEQQHIAGIIE